MAGGAENRSSSLAGGSLAGGWVFLVGGAENRSSSLAGGSLAGGWVFLVGGAENKSSSEGSSSKRPPLAFGLDGFETFRLSLGFGLGAGASSSNKLSFPVLLGRGLVSGLLGAGKKSSPVLSKSPKRSSFCTFGFGVGFEGAGLVRITSLVPKRGSKNTSLSGTCGSGLVGEAPAKMSVSLALLVTCKDCGMGEWNGMWTKMEWNVDKSGMELGHVEWDAWAHARIIAMIHFCFALLEMMTMHVIVNFSVGTQ